MGDVERGRGNIIKLASSTGHDIVQVTGHAFTRVRILIFFSLPITGRVGL